MAATEVQAFSAAPNTLDQVIEPLALPKKHDIRSELYYYKDPEDGSLPPPTYVHKPELNVPLPLVAQQVVVQDITGEEDKYTIDSHGFQYVKHESKEKNFRDDAQIKAVYYPEIEQLLKES